MQKGKLILPLLLLGLFAIDAHATTVDMQLVNVGPGYNDGSYYVYPYNFSINGSTSLTSLLCDDFKDDIFFGETWQANLYSFSDIETGAGQMNPSGGLVATGQRIAAYKDAAWLYQQLIANPTGSNAVSINHTIWGLFEATPYNGNQDVASWFAAANGATSGLTNDDASALFNDVGFYTPVVGSQIPLSDGRPQEFIGTVAPPPRPLIGEPVSVAEPPSVMVLGMGLFGLGAVLWRNEPRRGRPVKA